jgi:hypothetical protein
VEEALEVAFCFGLTVLLSGGPVRAFALAGLVYHLLWCRKHITGNLSAGSKKRCREIRGWGRHEGYPGSGEVSRA